MRKNFPKRMKNGSSANSRQYKCKEDHTQVRHAKTTENLKLKSSPKGTGHLCLS